MKASDGQAISLRACFLLLLYGGVAGIVLGIHFSLRTLDSFPTFTLILPGVVAVLASVVCGAILLYRSWRCVIRHAPGFGTRRTLDDPGVAVALALVPIVNLVGMFVAFGRLSGDLNRLAQAVGCRSRTPDDLGHLTATIAVMGLIPYVGVLFRIVAGLILIPLLLTSCERLAQRIEDQLAAPVEPAPRID